MLEKYKNVPEEIPFTIINGRPLESAFYYWLKNIPIKIPIGIANINNANTIIVNILLRESPFFIKDDPIVTERGTWCRRMQAVIIRDSVTRLYTPIERPSIRVCRIIAIQKVYTD